MKVMNKEITEQELHQLTHKTLDELYKVYEVKHSFTMCLYLRFNGDAEDPGELLTKEDFLRLCTNGGEWTTAYDALFQYIVKEYRLKQ
jgi:hypothetical protein